MRVFSIIAGKTRCEFSIDILDGQYVGMIDEEVTCYGSDYESIRLNIVNAYRKAFVKESSEERQDLN